MKVSAVIITFNEETIISKTLSQLGWCDEIIIIDSGSSDKTVEICKTYNCIIFQHAFEGFGEQKRYGVSKAKNDWILCVDADEVLTDLLIKEIKTELEAEKNNYSGFSIPRQLVFINHLFKYGKEANTPVIRLFNKNKGNWNGAEVHESVELSGPVKQLNNKILHFSYGSYSQYFHKLNLYSSLGAKNRFKLKRREKTNWLWLSAFLSIFLNSIL